MPAHRIISRSEWGARYAPGPHTRPIGDLERWLHHTVTVAPDLVPPWSDDYAAVRQVEQITETRFGWGIAYSYLVTPAGLIFEGHGIRRVGAHTQGHNRRGVGIALIGNYEHMKPTDAQLDAVAWLLRHGVTQGWWKTPTLSGGHRDTKPTACPGKYAYAALGEINRRAKNSAPTAPTKPAKRKRRPRRPPTIKRGKRGWKVRMWQQVLVADGHNLGRAGVDGVFGPITDRATRRWQGARGLVPDGIVGPRTWCRALTADANGRLARGDHNPHVRIWQHIAGAARDSIFGPRTQTRTREVQRYLNTTDDGVVGPKTARALLRRWI